MCFPGNSEVRGQVPLPGLAAQQLLPLQVFTLQNGALHRRGHRFPSRMVRPPLCSELRWEGPCLHMEGLWGLGSSGRAHGVQGGPAGTREQWVGSWGQDILALRAAGQGGCSHQEPHPPLVNTHCPEAKTGHWPAYVRSPRGGGRGGGLVRGMACASSGCLSPAPASCPGRTLTLSSDLPASQEPSVHRCPIWLVTRGQRDSACCLPACEAGLWEPLGGQWSFLCADPLLTTPPTRGPRRERAASGALCC